MADATYVGERTRRGCRVRVSVDGGSRWLRLPKRLDLCNHSPTGFEWGYEGSGPAQLALAILAHHLGAKRARMGRPSDGAGELAVRCHQEYKRAIIARLPKLSFTIRGVEIAATLVRLGGPRRGS